MKNLLSLKSLSVLLSFAIILVLVVVLVYREVKLERPEQIQITTSGRVDMCLECHTKEKLDPAHDAKVDHNGEQVGADGDEPHFPRKKQHEHDAENHDDRTADEQ